MMDEQVLYHSNLRLNEIERSLGRIRLRSMPRYLSLVVGDLCNIDCPHCYQAKTGDGLFRPDGIGPLVRRELQAFYPYLSTLRVQGGEVFVNPGFEELIDEVSATVSRPILSISTNGTLINDRWAERLVRQRFKEVTFSIDGATEETFAQLRRGARLRSVLGNLDRLQRWKAKCGSPLPQINIFCVLMRSNFREFGAFLRLARQAGVDSISFQTMGLVENNLARNPALVDEEIQLPPEVSELHRLVTENLALHGRHFREINVSGLKSLFARHHLDTDFITEDFSPDKPETQGVSQPARQADPDRTTHEANSTPHEADSTEIDPSSSLCPNPWVLMYLTERGDVHICYMARPIGNVYETPLIELWNAPGAISARSRMVRGRYMEAGCSAQWCSHKEEEIPSETDAPELVAEFGNLVRAALKPPDAYPEPDPGSLPDVIRRLLASRNQRIAELEWSLADLCRKNQAMLDEIDHRRQAEAARASELENQLDLLGGGKANRATAAVLRLLRKLEGKFKRADKHKR